MTPVLSVSTMYTPLVPASLQLCACATKSQQEISSKEPITEPEPRRAAGIGHEETRMHRKTLVCLRSYPAQSLGIEAPLGSFVEGLYSSCLRGGIRLRATRAREQFGVLRLSVTCDGLPRRMRCRMNEAAAS